MARRTPIRAPARVVFRQGREHLRFDPPNLLLTTLKVAAAIAVVAIAERSSTFTDYNAPKRPVEFQPPNTLLTLLAPPAAPALVAPPFNQEDWPNPLRSPVRDLTWTQSPKVQPQQIVPAAAAEGPRSHGILDYFSKQQPFVFDPPNLLPLLAQPPVVIVQAPFEQADWPNPVVRTVRDLTWTQSQEVIPQVADIAVANRIQNQTDWPNPLRPWQRDLTWTQSPAVPPTSIPPVPAPFAQEDWPNPAKPWLRDLTWTQSPKVQQIVPEAAVAEGQRSHGILDYFAKQQPVVFDPPNTLALLTQPVVVIPAGTVKPFLQKDWPNPVLRTARLKTTPQSFRPDFDVVVTEAAGSVFPFSLLDQPNPVLRKPFKESGWIKFANIGDIPARPTPVVSTPFSQNNWPNPVLRKVRIKTPESFRPGFDVAVETTTASTPFSQADWPNPIRRISPKEWGFTRFANISDIPQRFIAPLPFDQTDWPNPLRPWQRDFTWLQSPQVQQIVPEAASNFPPAFVQTEWPNPVLRTPFKESGWVRFANIGDIPAAAPPIPVPPTPTDEVKPSGGRVDHEFKYAIEGRKTYAQKLRDLRIAQEAAEVIEQVALQQAATLEVDEIRNARELKKALRLAKVEDDVRYLELLAERRELAKNEEIGALLYKSFQDEEDILALLMIASQLL